MFPSFIQHAVDKAIASLDSSTISDAFEGQYNFAMWKLYTEVYKIIAKNGGVMFGGCVRDYYDRRCATDAYYSKCRENHMSRRGADLSYNDKSVFPGLFDARRRLPHDIDVFIDECNVKMLYEAIENEGFILRGYIADKSYLISAIGEAGKFLEHRKLTLTLKRTPAAEFGSAVSGYRLHKQRIKIDLIIKKTGCTEPIYPPFGRPDFRCNALFMSMSECSVFPYIFTRDGVVETEAKDDIIAKRAVLLRSDVEKHRIEKMVRKGYTTHTSF